MNETLQRRSTFGSIGVNVILGVWVVISPFVLGFSGMKEMMWNNIATGGAIFLLALGSSTGRGGSSLLNVLLGIWMVISPFVLGASRPIAVWNNVILGTIVGIVALFGTHRALAPTVAPHLPNR
ncbi:MAG TPA: SPW repeat protein [Verrucomicrobiae bacterium]|nr:SPW repeat protein [Verrucomicrobiae bacterium]